jgi:hypothetical protein
MTPEDPISFDCFCGRAHCDGSLTIQPDTVNGQHVFMVTAVDTRGNDEGSLWLTAAQMTQLSEEITQMVHKNT